MTDNKLTLLVNNSPEIKTTKIMKFTPDGFKDITPVVLFDKSGSMNAEDCPGHESRIDVVNKILKKMLNLPVYAFSDNVVKAEYSKLEAYGSTNLLQALEICSHYSKVILVSDGCPDDSVKAMVKAITLKIPFDTILIGNDEEGKKFMQELSQRTNGKFSTVETSDINFQAKLESGINKLLLSEGDKK
jgi:hypothetical protein